MTPTTDSNDFNLEYPDEVDLVPTTPTAPASETAPVPTKAAPAPVSEPATTQVPTTVPAPTTPPVSATTPPATQPQQAQPAPTTTPTTAQPTVPAPAQPQPTAPPVPAIDTAEMDRRRQAWVSTLEAQYALTPEQKDLMVAEPEKVLPAMAARMVVNTYEAIVQYLNHVMPQMVSVLSQQAQTQRRHTDKFQEAWPQIKLDDPAHVRAIQAASASYRQFNPTATPEQAIQDIGRTVLGLLGITTQAQTQAPNPAPPPRPVPFTHAAPGVPSATPLVPEQRSAQAGNYFTDLVNSLDLSDI